MKLGIQLPNHTRPLSDLEIARLKALNPDLVRAYTYTTRQQLQQVIDAVGPVLVILTHLTTGKIDPAAWAQEFWQAAAIIRDQGMGLWINPANEPNHPDGPYPTLDHIEEFKRDYGTLVGELDRVFPGVPLISPNLAVRHLDWDWAMRCHDLFSFHRYIGTNAYWQYENNLVFEWGLRVTGFRNIYPDKEFVVLEMGDSTPNEGSLIKCQRMKNTIRHLDRLGYVAATSIFILGYDETAPETWGGFTYRPEDLRALHNQTWSEGQLHDLALGIAKDQGLPWELVDRLIEYESGYNPRAVSPAGAEGLMQLMPQFYADVDRFNAHENLEAGFNTLVNLLDAFRWDWAKVLAAYNWGSGNVGDAEEAFGGYWWTALPQETVPYIRKILFNR